MFFNSVYRWGLREGNPCWLVFQMGFDIYPEKQCTWLHLANLEQWEIQKERQKWMKKVPSYNIFSIPTRESISSCQLITTQLISQSAVKGSVEPEVADKFSAQRNMGNNRQCQSITLSSTDIVHVYKKIQNMLFLMFSPGSSDVLNQFVNFLLPKLDSLWHISVVYRLDTLIVKIKQFTHALEWELFSSTLKFSCIILIQLAILHLYKCNKKWSKGKHSK